MTQNARQAFDEELKDLSDSLIRMGAMATHAIAKAVRALLTNDRDLAREVAGSDDELDEMERSIEQKSLRLLLRQQPVASDLRKISTAIKMVTDIERIGDAAEDISEITLLLDIPVFSEIEDDLKKMAETAILMVSASIDAYVKEDLELAKATMKKDDIVDEYFLKIRGVLAEKIRTDPTHMHAAMDYLMIIKYLERVGDHAENICEWVEFYKTGIRKDERIF